MKKHPKPEHLNFDMLFTISPREIEYMRGRARNNSNLSQNGIRNVPNAIGFRKNRRKESDSTQKQQPCDSYIARLHARIFKESEE